MLNEPIHFWRCTGSGLKVDKNGMLEFASLPISIFVPPRQRCTYYQLMAEDSVRTCPHLTLIMWDIQGLTHISLPGLILRNNSADAIKLDRNQFQAMRIQSRSDPIAVRTGLNNCLVIVKMDLPKLKTYMSPKVMRTADSLCSFCSCFSLCHQSMTGKEGKVKERGKGQQGELTQHPHKWSVHFQPGTFLIFSWDRVSVHKVPASQPD